MSMKKYTKIEDKTRDLLKLQFDGDLHWELWDLIWEEINDATTAKVRYVSLYQLEDLK
jgi:hypothetical protein